MEMITLILSGLALLAAIISLALNVRNEKRSNKRNAALVHYISDECKAVSTAAGSYTDEHTKKVIERIEKLEQGITPDYEQAKVAANAVNDFNRGISNILGFDPHEALLASRRKDVGESE